MIEDRDFAAASMIGARKRQEDDCGVYFVPEESGDEALLLAAVADGMGGMPAGDQASRITIRAFFDSYPLIAKPPAARLRDALAHANHEVRVAVEADPTLRGMGSTLVAALFFEDRFRWLSVGDSLIFHWRGGELERINPLHNYGRELDARAARGEISAMHAALHPERAAITSVVMGRALDEVAEGELDLVVGDIVVLASDGIETLPEAELASLLADLGGAPADRIAGAILQRISDLAVYGQDNVTVVVVRPPASRGSGPPPKPAPIVTLDELRAGLDADREDR